MKTRNRRIARTLGFGLSAAAIGLAAVLAMSAGTLVAAKPVAVPDTAIQVEFRNAASPADRLLSDSVSPSYTDAYAGVQAKIAGSSGWVQLYTCVSSTSRGKTTCNSQGRGQTFDFTDPSQQYFPPPYPTVTRGAQMQVWVFADDGVTKLANGFRAVMNHVGEQRRGGSKTNFYIDGVMHTVRFTPNFYATSDFLLVTYLGGSLSCSTADPSKCATWSVETSSMYGDIAEFVTGDNSKDYGQFHMPFKMTVRALPK